MGIWILQYFLLRHSILIIASCLELLGQIVLFENCSRFQLGSVQNRDASQQLLEKYQDRIGCITCT